MEQLLRLKEIWEREKIRTKKTASEEEILSFEARYSVRLPKDFCEYFKLVNGMDGGWDNKFYEFYPLNKVGDAATLLKDYGIPRHGDTITVLDNPESYFVFANYSINLIAYAIKMSNTNTCKNIVYAICGGAHKIIAESFTEFISIYLENSDNLMI